MKLKKKIQPRTTDNELSRFIAEFNFADPDWSKLPSGFPELEKEGLTKLEKYLLDGTKTAWFVGTQEGKRHFKNNLVRKAGLNLSAAVILIALYLGANLILPENKNYSKPVNAATISARMKNFQFPSAKDVNNLVESTMSAVFK